MSVLNAKYNFVLALVLIFRCVFVRFWYPLGSVCVVPRMYSLMNFLVFFSLFLYKDTRHMRINFVRSGCCVFGKQLLS